MMWLCVLILVCGEATNIRIVCKQHNFENRYLRYAALVVCVLHYVSNVR
jgi:hypothetical protein